MDCSIHISFEMHIRALRMTKKQGHHLVRFMVWLSQGVLHCANAHTGSFYHVTVTFLAGARETKSMSLPRISREARLKKATEEEGRP